MPKLMNGQQTTREAESEVRACLAAGNLREAFERLLGLYQEKVFHLCLSMVRNPAAAEDISQEAFLRVWKGLPTYHGEASLSTWIYVIARNTCLTELKKLASRPTVSLEDPGLEGLADRLPALRSAERALGSEMDVNQLLAGLPEKYRQVITLFYLEQKSYEDVAALLSLPMGTVKTYLFRAKKELLRLARRQNLTATLA